MVELRTLIKNAAPDPSRLSGFLHLDDGAIHTSGNTWVIYVAFRGFCYSGLVGITLSRRRQWQFASIYIHRMRARNWDGYPLTLPARRGHSDGGARLTGDGARLQRGDVLP